jgi:hypothetical protein
VSQKRDAALPLHVEDLLAATNIQLRAQLEQPAAQLTAANELTQQRDAATERVRALEQALAALKPPDTSITSEAVCAARRSCTRPRAVSTFV